MRTTLLLSALACCVGLIGFDAWRGSDQGPGPAHSVERTATAATNQVRSATLPEVRSPATEGGDEVAPRAPRSFEEVYVELVGSLMERRDGAREAARSAAAVPAGAVAPASGPMLCSAGARTAADDSRERLLAEMVTEVATPGQHAMRKLAALPGSWQDDVAVIHVFACRVIIDLSLQFTSHQADRAMERRELVATMLDYMPFSRDFTTFTHTMLRQKPWLEMVHEARLLALLDTAKGDLEFLARPVQDLLATLWCYGDVNNEDVLALLDGSRGKPLEAAALHRLLLTPSYRRMAIERLLETHDPVTMDEAAMFAAKRLPATDALFVVSALKSSPEGEGAYFAAYRGLAERHPADLAASYQQCLADGVMPAHRMNAIMSLGNVGELQRDTVRLAFDQDPSYRVKGVALLALASELPTAEFAPLFDTALADPGFLGAEFGPSDLGNALRNHALVRRGDSNFIARATTALLAVLPTGNDAVRTRLEATRREFVMR